MARSTAGLHDTHQEPSAGWKRKILLAEHSPIRLLQWTWLWEDLPYWVSVHLVRHKVGCEHFVRSQRTDRTGVDRSELRQDALVAHTMTANAQSIISISRRRLCEQASWETRTAWSMALQLLPKELREVCVPECVYRGFCPEMKSCNWWRTREYDAIRMDYLR